MKKKHKEEESPSIDASSNSEIKKTKKSNVYVKRTSQAISLILVAGCAYLYVDRFYNIPSNAPSKPIQVTGMVQELPQPLSKPIAAVQLQPSVVSIIEPIPEVPIIIQGEVLTSRIPFWLDSSKIQIVQAVLPKQEHFEFNDEEDAGNYNVKPIVDRVVVIPKVTPRPEKKLVQHKQKPHKQAQHKQASKNASGAFTIQLLAGHAKDKLIHIKNAKPAFAKAKIMHYKNDKGSWYVLTLGEYKSRAQAQAMIQKLPTELAQLHPWIRPTLGLSKNG